MGVGNVNNDEWRDRAEELATFLTAFDKHIWPVFERFGYSSKELALVAFLIGPDDEADDEEEPFT